MKRSVEIRVVYIVAALALLMAAPARPAAADETKAVFGLPGIPPVFGTVVAYVAARQGFFKKHGVEVTLRPFDSGAAAARAVASGDIEMSLSPTPLVINQLSNSDVQLVAIYGLENPDWLLATTDPAIASCKEIAGKQVGVDSIGGARSIALKELIRTCGLKIESVQQVPLSTNTDQAMVAGQLKVGVLHLDDVPRIEGQTKKPLKILVTQKDAAPVSHYLVIVAHRDKLAKNRATFVKMLAGLIDAQAFMKNPANAARVAEIAGETGRPAADAQKALKQYLAMEFWPDGHPGLTRKNLDAVTAKQVAVGNIPPDKKPVAYERLTDASVWQDALKLTKGH